MKKYFLSSEAIEQSRRDYLKIRNRPPDPFPLPRLETSRAPFFNSDVNAINEIGFTRLWYAVLEDQDATETKRLLEAKANVNPPLQYDDDDDLLPFNASNYYLIMEHAPTDCFITQFNIKMRTFFLMFCRTENLNL
jgi:hypothetical protein